MLSATSRRKAVLHCAAWSKVSGGTNRVLVRRATEALAITAMPQAGTEALSFLTALRMTTPLPRETPSGARLARQVVWPAYRLKAKSGNGARSQTRERQFADLVSSSALNDDVSETGSSSCDALI